MKNISAVLFDFDGVIAHTIPVFRQALFQFFREKQLKVTESEFETDGWASKSLAQFCCILAERYNIHFKVEELRGQIWQTQVDLMNAGLESDPSLIPFLEYCKATWILVAIGSNSFRDRVEWVIKKMNIDSYFLHDQEHPEKWYNIIGANDLTHHKPDPEVWVKCSDMLGVDIKKCLVIEDGLPGLTGAKKCGAQSAYYHRFCRPEKECVEIAGESVESFSELL